MPDAQKLDTSTLPTVAEPDSYFHHVDLLRGLAALSILFWHYQHFYWQNGPAEAGAARSAPLFHAFRILYEQGHYAVQLFWALSGFVFASVYGATPVSARAFVMRRLARLYPLHLLTLVAVALIQAVSVHLVHRYQIFGNNDLYHFILNLFLVSSWGFERGLSFNGPVWSVSTEIFSYGVFFVSLRLLRRSTIVYGILEAGLFYVLLRYAPFGTGLFSCAYLFFLGTVAYGVVKALRYRPEAIFAISVACMASRRATFLFVGLVLFFAAIDRVSGSARLGRRVKILGDLSFGVYLWHVPLQMTALIVMEKYGIPSSVFDRTGALVLFILVTYALAYLSYAYYEVPLRRWLRRRAVKHEGAPPGAEVAA